MPPNNRVTQRQHFEDLAKLGEGLGKSVADLDNKLGAKVDAVLAAVAENRVANAGEYASLQTGLQSLQERLTGKGGVIDRIGAIDGPGGRLTVLEHSDRKVGFWAGLVGVVSAAIAAIIGSRQ